MPTHDRGRRHDLHRLPPGRPDAREQHPEQPIDPPEARSLGRSVQHGKLMPEGEDSAASSSRERIVAPSEASRATNSAVMLPENGISLRRATATATTRTEYSVGTGPPTPGRLARPTVCARSGGWSSSIGPLDERNGQTIGAPRRISVVNVSGDETSALGLRRHR
jgi:hypothetical protein